MKTITLIIPVYNVEQYIEDCLYSVVQQTYTNGIECVLIDDCGKDNSIEIINRFIAQYNGPISFKVIHHQNNRGLSAARNTGLKVAQGQYVMFIDSDDKITNDCIEKLLVPLNSYDYDMVVPNFITLGTSDNFTKCNKENIAIIGNQNIVKSRIDGNWYVMAWAKLYRRQFLLDNGLDFCEGIIHEDELFTAEIATLLSSIYILGNSSTYIYRLRENSITTSLIYDKRKKSYVRILDHMRLFMNNHRLIKHLLPNELFLNQFYMACKISLDISTDAYYSAYEEYREVSRVQFSQLFIKHKSVIKIIRDLHFLFPPVLGKRMYRYMLILYSYLSGENRR